MIENTGYLSGSQQAMVPFRDLTLGVNPYGDSRTENVQDIVGGLTLETIATLAPLDILQDGNLVIAGRRRYEAINQLLSTLTKKQQKEVMVPVKFWDISKEDTIAQYVVAIAENERRKTATPIEQARALASLVKLGLTAKEACKYFPNEKGKPRDGAWASQCLRIIEASEVCPQFAKEAEASKLGFRPLYDLIGAFFSEDPTKNIENLKDLAKRLKAQDPELMNRVGRLNTVAEAKQAKAENPPAPTPEPEKSKKSKKKKQDEPANDLPTEDNGPIINEITANTPEGFIEPLPEPATKSPTKSPTKSEYISVKAFISLLDQTDTLLAQKVTDGNPCAEAAQAAFRHFDNLVVKCLKGKMDVKKLAKAFVPKEEEVA